MVLVAVVNQAWSWGIDVCAGERASSFVGPDGGQWSSWWAVAMVGTWDIGGRCWWPLSIERGDGGVDIHICERASFFVASDGGRLSSMWAVGCVLSRCGQSLVQGG